MDPAPSQLFSHHPRSWRDNHFVYAVVSRRSKGLSIGIELNPDKVCNFDCVYCCVDRTVPAARQNVDLDVLARELDHLLGMVGGGEIWNLEPFDKTPPPLRRLNDLAFSGSGEPTSCPQFTQACEIAARALENRGLRNVKIVLITNATLFHKPQVAKALAYLDEHDGEIWAKLDAGTEAYYRLVERTTIPLARVLENIAVAGRIRPIVIQSLFMNVKGTPPGDSEIDAYVGRLRELIEMGCRIKLVQVYTVARRTAEAYVMPLNERQLELIAARVRSLGLVAEVHP